MKPDYDTPWKLMLERYFRQLFEFVFPEITQEIDWSIPHAFLESLNCLITPLKWIN